MKRILSISLFFLIPVLCIAQTTVVTFNINLKPMLKDSTFVPGQNFIQVTGNIYPLSTRPVRLTDTNPVDSVYSAEIRFSSRTANQELEYNYEIITPEGKKTEQLPRKISLRGREIDIPPLYFNAFAW